MVVSAITISISALSKCLNFTQRTVKTKMLNKQLAGASANWSPACYECNLQNYN